MEYTGGWVKWIKYCIGKWKTNTNNLNVLLLYRKVKIILGIIE
jgi:hypothetical protein